MREAELQKISRATMIQVPQKFSSNEFSNSRLLLEKNLKVSKIFCLLVFQELRQLYQQIGNKY
jgi:hypothetical protein